jgi:hypothetical protein
LDFSDDAHYRFILRQLQTAGLTADKSPQLFSALEAARQGQSPANGANGANGSNDSNASPTFSITKLETTDGVNYTATAEANIPVPVVQLVLHLELFDENLSIIGLNSEAKYDCDGTVTLTATGKLNWPTTPGQQVTALLTWTYLPYNGYPSCGVVKSTSLSN